MIRSSSIGWSQFSTAWFLCLFITVLAIIPHQSREGYPRWLNSTEQQKGQNPMERSPRSTKKTLPILTNQSNARMKIRWLLGEWENWKQDGNGVRHRLGWVSQHWDCDQQVIARVHFCHGVRTYCVSLKEPNAAGHQSSIHSPAYYLSLLCSAPESALCVFPVQLMTPPFTWDSSWAPPVPSF